MHKIKGNFICFNGDVLKKSDFKISLNNRAFKYGDGIFETIRAINSKLMFYNEHSMRAKRALKKLQISFNNDFFENELKENILHLLQVNKHFAGARIRVTFFRNGEGLYTPTQNNLSYLIETKELENEIYTLKKQGIKLGVFPDIKITHNHFSGFKSINNTLPYILASIYKKENNFDDCLIYNINNELCEATSSNLFIIKDGSLFTPSLDCGCVNGIMRETIIEIALSMSITVFEEAVIRETEILNADEIFLTNAIEGIKWIVAYKNKRYFNKITKKIFNELLKLV